MIIRYNHAYNYSDNHADAGDGDDVDDAAVDDDFSYGPVCEEEEEKDDDKDSVSNNGGPFIAHKASLHKKMQTCQVREIEAKNPGDRSGFAKVSIGYCRHLCDRR